MAKTIIPIKLIVETNQDGAYNTGVLQYQINEDGSIGKPKTIGINNGITLDTINGILAEAKRVAEQGEGIE